MRGKIAPRSPVSTQVMLNVSARTTLRNLTAAAATLSALVACGPSVTTGQTQGGGGTPVVSNCAADTTYTSLQASLDARKTQFLGPNVQNLVPINTRLYWYDTTNFAPVLNGYTDGGSILAYTFSVGDSIDDANWEGFEQPHRHCAVGRRDRHLLRLRSESGVVADRHHEHRGALGRELLGLRR